MKYNNNKLLFWIVNISNGKWWHQFPLGTKCHRSPLSWTGALEGFPGGAVVKNPADNAGDTDSIPGLGRSPGEGNGDSLQYFCLGNPMDRGAWQATVHGVTKFKTQVINWNSKTLLKCEWELAAAGEEEGLEIQQKIETWPGSGQVRSQILPR